MSTLDPINTITILRGDMEYIISQVRTCRKCGNTMDMIDNFEMHFNKQHRIALWQHVNCNPKEYGRSFLADHMTNLMSPEDKQKFLYPDRAYDRYT